MKSVSGQYPPDVEIGNEEKLQRAQQGGADARDAVTIRKPGADKDFDQEAGVDDWAVGAGERSPT